MNDIYDEYPSEPTRQPKKKSGYAACPNLAALMRSDAKSVHVSFESGNRTYTYITHLDLAEGDYVVVPVAPNGVEQVSLARVGRVDDEVTIDPSSKIVYRWVIAKVDMAVALANEERNRQIEALARDAHRANLRASFSQQLLGAMNDDQANQLRKLL